MFSLKKEFYFFKLNLLQNKIVLIKFRSEETKLNNVIKLIFYIFIMFIFKYKNMNK